MTVTAQQTRDAIGVLQRLLAGCSDASKQLDTIEQFLANWKEAAKVEEFESMRDEMARAALPALQQSNPQIAATEAYRYADAMMNERETTAAT